LAKMTAVKKYTIWGAIRKGGDFMLYYEVVGASTRRFSVEGIESDYSVIAELVDKQTGRKIYAEKLLNTFGANQPNIETYLLPTTFQTTDNDPSIVRLDDFIVVSKVLNGFKASTQTFSHSNLCVVCDRLVARNEKWSK